ncbi:c-type cytochrome [Leptospira harrisiae]|uniref:Cytochrome C n=1 Tax=Leptospira harrisiae TaxID=2023189 RepID=A0A2N0AKR5_9LEPT|nr:cytochrome c [Leptospira harrisiae]PJZ84908.1 cytochrome C [Leptospira harrisiae]PKA08411.1 cytochrome C [Leptospira harrisiae]
MNIISLILANVPVPKDIPLPLPAPEWLLVGVLVFSFLCHILFVNLMVGGTLLTFFAQLKGLREKDYDTLAHEIAKTITVNKSMAVVLGVAPLLAINTLYTVYFYSANALTGLFWISIVPLVTVAFLLTYPHKYLWEKLQNNKGLHISMIGAASGIFLFIPLIFLTNINLMLYPDKWGTITGFFSAMFLPNVFPRYLHFIFASLTATGLFLFYYFGRESYSFEKKFLTLTRYEVRKRMYSLAFMATLLQFVAGPLILLTLPSIAISWNLFYLLGPAILLAIYSLYLMWNGINANEEKIGKDFIKVVITLSVVVVLMVSGRHVVRETALGPHKKLVKERTLAYESKIQEAFQSKTNQKEVTLASSEKPNKEEGGKIFRGNCSACHSLKTKVVGPPVTEMVSIYKKDRSALIAWIKAPGKKRKDYPQMPGFPSLSEGELDSLAEYILDNP